MKHRVAPALFMIACWSGCSSPVVTVQQNPPQLQSADYANFVTRRTIELQQMGGPFADKQVAVAKAEQDAQARFGNVQPEYTSTATWGSGARNAQEQAKVKDTLEKMDRDETRL